MLKLVLGKLSAILILCLFFTVSTEAVGKNKKWKFSKDHKVQPSEDLGLVFGPERFKAKTKRSKSYIENFEVESPELSYILKIQNGKEAGQRNCEFRRGFGKLVCHFYNFKKYLQAKKTRVLYGNIELNGEVIVSASELNIATGSLEVPVSLDSKNQLRIELFGHSNAFIILSVQTTDGPVNQPPSVVITAQPQSGFAPLEVAFDAGDTVDDQDSSENLQYEWDFGDGSDPSNELAPVHVYDQVGIFPVVLTVTDSGGLSASTSIDIEVSQNNAPLAVILANPTAGRSPLDVAFSAEGSSDDNTQNENLIYEWDFGDGSGLGSGLLVNHTYQTAGNFEAALTVTDEQGLSSTASVIISAEENQAPVAVLSASPTSGNAPLEVLFNADQSSDPDADSIEYFWNFGDGNVGSGITTNHTYLTVGQFTATLTVTDSFGLASQDSVLIEVQEKLFGPDSITIASPIEGETVNQSPIVINGTSDTVLSSVSVNGQNLALSPDGLSFSGSQAVMISGPLALTFEAVASSGEVAEKIVNVNVVLPGDEEPELPPDPATVAPQITKSGYIPTVEQTSFLYTGPNPIQKNVDTSMIDPVKIGVVRGLVLDQNGDPLTGVIVEARDNEEFGQTLSRADGRYDFVLNGDTELVLNFAKPGFLPVQRRILSRKQDFLSMKPIVMTQLAPKVTKVNFSESGAKVFEGTVAEDFDGQRRATVFIPDGVSANLRMPDGSTSTVNQLSFRATEYTTGYGGLEAMPGELPATSAFTYAVELSADEAIAAGAEKIEFSEPVALYVENFLGAPQG